MVYEPSDLCKLACHKSTRRSAVIFDYNVAGKVVGIEMLSLCQRISPEKISRILIATVD
ncbi:MAG: hypothetical protein GX456_03960 [Verrucomicrobia bacterium]|nr:hypothetical protein [Verrucomicrobiota bacterium]